MGEMSSGRDENGGIVTIEGVRLKAEELESTLDSGFDDLLLDAVAGIAGGCADDPVALCREICRVGAELSGEPESWLTWEGVPDGS